MIVEIPRYLKHGKESTDRRIFENWMFKTISTETAIKRFKRNNGIRDDVNINEKEFEVWLKSLGYERIY